MCKNFKLHINLFHFHVEATPLPRVQGVTVTGTVRALSPALRVSWSAVRGSGITYTVCYSTNRGSQSYPPSGANCGASGITGTSTTLGPVSQNTTYYIWVRAESSGEQGPYSDRVQKTAYNGMWYICYSNKHQGILCTYK